MCEEALCCEFRLHSQLKDDDDDDDDDDDETDRQNNTD